MYKKKQMRGEERAKKKKKLPMIPHASTAEKYVISCIETNGMVGRNVTSGKICIWSDLLPRVVSNKNSKATFGAKNKIVTNSIAKKVLFKAMRRLLCRAVIISLKISPAHTVRENVRTRESFSISGKSRLFSTAA